MVIMGKNKAMSTKLIKDYFTVNNVDYFNDFYFNGYAACCQCIILLYPLCLGDIWLNWDRFTGGPTFRHFAP